MRLLILFITLIIVFICLFSYTVNTYIMNDEHMYVSAGVLAQSNTVYKDFAYLQMPYLPLVYAGIYKFTGTDLYLLYARYFSFLTVFASVVIIYLIGYLLTKEFLLALMGVLLYSFNEVLIHSMGFAWNAAPPIVFSLLAVYCYLYGTKRDDVKPLYLFITGLCIALAAGLKLYYITMVIPFVACSIVLPKSFTLGEKLRYSLFPLLFGFTMGLLPALYYFISDPQIFLFNNIGFHKLNYEWHLENNLLTVASTTSLLPKIRYLIQVAGWQTSMPLLIAVPIAIVFVAYNHKSLTRIFTLVYSNVQLFLIVSVLLVSILSVMIPSPLWQHHLAYPFPFIVLLVFTLYNYISLDHKKIYLSVIAIVVLFISIYGFPVVSSYIQHLTDYDRWTPVRFHREAQSITEHIGKDGKIVTIEPLIALEGGRMVYNEFSTGHFLFHVSEILNSQQRELYSTTSLPSLQYWLEEVQPAGIVIPPNYRRVDQFRESIDHTYYFVIENASGNYEIYVRK